LPLQGERERERVREREREGESDRGGACMYVLLCGIPGRGIRQQQRRSVVPLYRERLVGEVHVSTQG